MGLRSLLIADPAAELGIQRPGVLPTTLIIRPDGSLAATLAGCSLNPFANDDDEAATPAPASAPPQSYDSSAQSSVPEYGGPVVQRVSEPVPLADNHPNEYVVQVGDTLWDIAATFRRA